MPASGFSGAHDGQTLFREGFGPDGAVEDRGQDAHRDPCQIVTAATEGTGGTTIASDMHEQESSVYTQLTISEQFS